jgi:hypothetical protein
MGNISSVHAHCQVDQRAIAPLVVDPGGDRDIKKNAPAKQNEKPIKKTRREKN